MFNRINFLLFFFIILFSSCSSKINKYTINNKINKNNIYENEEHFKKKFRYLPNYTFLVPDTLNKKLNYIHNVKYKIFLQNNEETSLIFDTTSHKIDDLNIDIDNYNNDVINKICFNIFRNNTYVKKCLKNVKKSDLLHFKNRKILNFLNSRDKNEIGINIFYDSNNKSKINTIKVKYSNDDTIKEIIRYNLLFFIKTPNKKEKLLRKICEKDDKSFCLDLIKEEHYFHIYGFPNRSITKLPIDLDIDYALKNTNIIFDSHIYKNNKGFFINFDELDLSKSIMKNYFHYLDKINKNLKE